MTQAKISDNDLKKVSGGTNEDEEERWCCIYCWLTVPSEHIEYYKTIAFCEKSPADHRHNMVPVLSIPEDIRKEHNIY